MMAVLEIHIIIDAELVYGRKETGNGQNIYQSQEKTDIFVRAVGPEMP